MVKLRKSWNEFSQIAQEKGLQIFFGDLRSDSYSLLAIDGQVNYECRIPKDNGPDQLDFENNYLSGVENYINPHPAWDDIQISCPSSVTELHTYYKDGVIIQQIMSTFSSASKKTLTRVQRII